MTAFATPQKTSPSAPPKDSRERVGQWMRQIQDEICQGLAEADGGAEFQQDAWERPEGGGGR
ncbi:MAG: coproporphyrinogen III oxidase, partial [Cyanobacteria bacterium P01_H01_bin.130]